VPYLEDDAAPCTARVGDTCFNMAFAVPKNKAAKVDALWKEHEVGRCRLTLSNPRRKRLELSAGNLNMINCFQILLSNSTCAAATRR
jgi:hypothetical protein